MAWFQAQLVQGHEGDSHIANLSLAAERFGTRSAEVGNPPNLGSATPWTGRRDLLRFCKSFSSSRWMILRPTYR